MESVYGAKLRRNLGSGWTLAQSCMNRAFMDFLPHIHSRGAMATYPLVLLVIEYFCALRASITAVLPSTLVSRIILGDF